MLVQWHKCSWFILSMLPIKLGEREHLEVFKFNIHQKSINMLKIVLGMMVFCISVPFQNTGRYSISAESKETIYSILIQLEKVQNYLYCVIANGLVGIYDENLNIYVTAWRTTLETCWLCHLSCWKMCLWWGGRLCVSEISSRKNSCNDLCSLYVFDNNSKQMISE